MFSKYQKEDLKLIEALCVLGKALDEPKNPNRDMYIKACVFVGAAIFMDFLGYNK